MGTRLQTDYSRLTEIRELLGNPTTIALTATATAECQHDIAKQLGLSIDQMKRFHEGIDRPNLSLEVDEVWGMSDKLDKIEMMLSSATKQPGSHIVYFSLIKTLMEFSQELHRRDMRPCVITATCRATSGRQYKNDFMSGDTEIVLATNAFGMGVDKEDIRT